MSSTAAHPPAPGSDVPGAPPALKRPLTDVDGLRSADRPPTPARQAASTSERAAAPPASPAAGTVTAWYPALGLLAAAATVATDTWWRARSATATRQHRR